MVLSKELMEQLGQAKSVEEAVEMLKKSGIEVDEALKEKIANIQSEADVMKLMTEMGVEMSDEELDKVSGGSVESAIKFWDKVLGWIG